MIEIRRWDAGADDWLPIPDRSRFHVLSVAKKAALDFYEKYPTVHLALFFWRNGIITSTPEAVVIVTHKTVH